MQTEVKGASSFEPVRGSVCLSVYMSYKEADTYMLRIFAIQTLWCLLKGSLGLIRVRRCDSNNYPQQMFFLWRNNSFLHFNTNARFPPFYCNGMLGANLGLLLNGDVSVMIEKMYHLSKQNTIVI